MFLLTPDEPGVGGPRAELTRRSLLTSAGLAGLLTACGSRPGTAPGARETRTVTHPLGTTEVPVAPQRVLSLDSNGALQVCLELGAPLVASETLDGAVPVPPYLPAPPPGFESLGFDRLDLERVAALRPDLVIGNVQRVEEAYAELSRIAPPWPTATRAPGRTGAIRSARSATCSVRSPASRTGSPSTRGGSRPSRRGTRT